MIPLRDDNPTRTRPYVTIGLVVSCVLVFIWQLTLGPERQMEVIFGLGFTPATLFGTGELPPEAHMVPPEVTLFSSMFLHGGGLHLAGNMLFLWIFGNNVEDAMGHLRFVFFYLLCGIAAAIAQAAPNPESAVPMIGASGAIAGVLGAYLLLYPRARVLVGIPLGLYIHLTYLPAMYVLGFWFLLQIGSSLLTRGAEDGVAWIAHIGGFLAGLILIPFFRRRGTPLWPDRE